MTKHWPAIQQAFTANHVKLADLEHRTNLKLPEDLKTLFGKDLRVSVGAFTQSTPARQLPVAVLARTDQASFKSLVARLHVSAKGVSITPARDGLHVAGANKVSAQHAADQNADRLSSQDGFQSTHPTTEQDQFGLHVDLAALQALLG